MSKDKCGECRYWSELYAQAVGGGPLEALCLCQTSEYRGKYTPENGTCDKWRTGELGAIDDPSWQGDDAEAAYARAGL